MQHVLGRMRGLKSQHVVLTAKITFAVMLYAFLLRYINERFQGFSLDIIINQKYVWPVIIILLLAALNIFIETVKWQKMLSPFSENTLKECFNMTLHGFCFGMITPIKIGDWIGKSLTFSGGREVPMAQSFVSSLLQNVVIGFFGVLAGWHWLRAHFYLLKTGGELPYALFLFLIIFLLLGGIVVIKKMDGLRKKLHQILQQLVHLPLKWWGSVTFLTMLRYLIYSAQLGIALNAFVSATFFALVAVIPLYFLLVTLVPSFNLADVGIRATTGLLLFNLAGNEGAGIVAAVALVWGVNQLLPALLGFASLMKYNFRPFTPLFKS